MVTDRTQADVDRVYLLKDKILKGTNTAQELAEWMAGMKGAYNASDMNRVGQAIIWIRDVLLSQGIVVSISVKTDWTYADIPTFEQMQNFLGAITNLKNATRLSEGTVPQTMNNLSFETANLIESLLISIDNVTEVWNNQLFHSSGAYSGMTGGLFL